MWNLKVDLSKPAIQPIIPNIPRVVGTRVTDLDVESPACHRVESCIAIFQCWRQQRVIASATQAVVNDLRVREVDERVGRTI